MHDYATPSAYSRNFVNLGVVPDRVRHGALYPFDPQLLDRMPDGTSNTLLALEDACRPDHYVAKGIVGPARQLQLRQRRCHERPRARCRMGGHDFLRADSQFFTGRSNLSRALCDQLHE